MFPLRGRPGLLDVSILHLGSGGDAIGDGTTLSVAFLCGPAAGDLAARATPAEWGVDALVAVTRVDDAAALAALPVWTPAALEGLGNALADRPAVTEAAVILQAVPNPRHQRLDALAPPAPVGLWPMAAAAPSTIEPPHLQHTKIGQPLSERPALIEAPRQPASTGFPHTLPEALEKAAVSSAGTVYVAADGTHYREGYDALRRRALALLGGLRTAGLTVGDRALLDVTDAAASQGALWACFLGGIVPVPVSLPSRGSDPGAFDRLRAAWDMLGRPRLLITGSADALPPEIAATALDLDTLSGAPAAAPPDPAFFDPDAQAVIFLTSGSTGIPKGVPQSHRAILSMANAACAHGLGLGSGDVFFNWMPRDHVGAVAFHAVASVALGCSQVHADTAHVLEDPVRWLDIVSKHRVSVTWSPNFAFTLIGTAAQATPPARRQWDLSALRAVMNGGEAVSEESLRAFLAVLAPHNADTDRLMVPSFGMSETCTAITLGQLGRAWGPFSSLGPPVAGCALRITDDDGHVLREGEIGRLEVRGPQVLAAYYDHPDLDAPAARGGWFDTGDMGFLADGMLYLTGRMKDTLNANGATYFAHEVEAAAAAVPGIDSTSVAAVAVQPPGATSEQIALFFAPLGEDADDAVVAALAQAVRRQVTQRLGLVCDPVIALPRAAFPRTGIGKIVRQTLAGDFAAGRFDDAALRVRRLLGGPGLTADLPLHSRLWRPAPLPDATTALPSDIDAGGGLLVVERAADGSAGHVRAVPATDPQAALLALARTVAAQADEDRPHTVIALTRGAMAASGDTPSRLPDALAPGLVRSLALLWPDVRWRAVDVELTAPPDGVRGILAQELSAPAEPLVAWRDGQRLVPRLTPADPQPVSAPPVVPGGLWLVAGGVGGIGRLVAERLLERGARLLIIGRSTRSALSPERAAALEHLATLGTVSYATVDVAAAAALAQAVAEAEATTGQPLAGAIHLAGQGRPWSLEDRDGDADLPVMQRTALAGLAALEALAAARPPGVRLLVAGSIVGPLGGRVPGYAAVQAALADAAQARIAAGVPLSFLAFSAWPDVGMSAGRTSAALLRADGLKPVDPALGLAVIEGALARPGVHWLVGLDDAHPHHVAFSDGPPRLAARPVAWVRGDHSAGAERHRDALGRESWVLIRPTERIPRTPDGALDHTRLAEGVAGARIAPRDDTERQVALTFAEVLGGDPPAVGDDFFVCGGTSLGAVRLAARLSSLFFVEVSVGMVFRQPTVEGMTRLLRDYEQQPGMTDAVAAHLTAIRADRVENTVETGAQV